MNLILDLFKGVPFLIVDGKEYYLVDQEGWEILESISGENEGLQNALLLSRKEVHPEHGTVYCIPKWLIEKL